MDFYEFKDAKGQSVYVSKVEGTVLAVTPIPKEPGLCDIQLSNGEFIEISDTPESVVSVLGGKPPLPARAKPRPRSNTRTKKRS